ncbi:lysine N(6)-hydroxylase/L-ornithine N(5)-oxygenase family protein [Olivibacter domesticus]|uniref:Lysine N6-hydroxylase n=1 Tax=Olivibacter domesticus TaxID=407022 RepID=A0A1H7MUG7_OLID1|nr:SidA/IucD/PvdA family monooxygenase [Olivibacter domesticus]SEL14247.1 lysine N6-hydroxylase [Olivibacter domesticus]
MENSKVYDFIGIGIGPFNLGLAALSQPIEDCNAIFLDKREEFNWHLGLMLDEATLQVPFMADLVTMADPTSPYSFLNFMKRTNRIYKFYIRENFFILRREYNAYCRWVVSQLANCLFSQEVLEVSYINDLYMLAVQHVNTKEIVTYTTKKIVLGTGTQPYIPRNILAKKLDKVIHTADYLYCKEALLKEKSITIVGSGQSAAEIFHDLLPHTRTGLHVNWITRSDRFFPLENHARLTLELTSPDYVDYFYALPAVKRSQLLSKQNILYKGVNYDLINQIFNELYAIETADGKVNVTMMANSELKDISLNDEHIYGLHFLQHEQDKLYNVSTNFVIMATGYKYKEPAFLAGIEDRLERTATSALDVKRNYTIDKNQQEVYVQNVELHSHGFVTPDLGMGAYRNSYILNELLGRVVYKVEEKIAFQTFGADEMKKGEVEKQSNEAKIYQ